MVFKGEVGTYWMTSRWLDEAAVGLDALEIYRCARQLLHWAVGAVRCGGLNCSTVRFIRWFDLVDEDGCFTQIKVPDEIELTSGIPFSYVPRVPSNAEPEPAFVSRLVQLAWARHDVGDALTLLSYEVLDWVTLYKIFEIVRSVAPNGVRTMTSDGWISASDLNAFTAAANRPEISGPTARHARLPGRPPDVEMSLTQAHMVIQALVRNCCQTLT